MSSEGPPRDNSPPGRSALPPASGRCPPSPQKDASVFCDSLSYYGPTGGLPADDPRIWPNIVAEQLDWDVELIGRIGWTCRDVWWAATRIRAHGRRCRTRAP